MTSSQLLIKCMRETGTSASQLAKASGFRVQRIREWKRGFHRPCWNTMIKLLEAMGYEIEIRSNA